jgi:hypothetical protein
MVELCERFGINDESCERCAMRPVFAFLIVIMREALGRPDAHEFYRLKLGCPVHANLTNVLV